MRLLRWSVLVATCGSVTMLAGGGWIAQAGDAEPRSNFDRRVDRQSTSFAAPQPAQLQAIERLRASTPGLAAAHDPRTGATRTLLVRGGYLSPARPTADPGVVAIEFAAKRHVALGLTAADLADHELTDRIRSSVTGATHVYLRQTHLGLPVYNGQLQINVNRDGRVLSVNNAFMPDIAAAANRSTAELPATAAVTSVADHLGIRLTGPPEVVAVSPDGVTTLRHPGLSSKNIDTRLMWLPIRAGEARLVRNLQVATVDGRHVYDINVDAVTGEVWTRFDWVDDDSYRVYPEPLESPNHSPTPPPADGRQIVVDPADPVASPFGWHDIDGVPGPEFTIHRGNNVHAYDDNDDTAGGICTSTPGPPPVEPDCGGSLDCDFEFPIDLGAEDPRGYVGAAVTNLFYWNNRIHDVQYRYGFDEAAGNFQQNNYGNGGVQNDYVLAEAQDGSGTNNANFCTPPDGQRPRMQMFLWSGAPRIDGDFDNGIIVHEYGHGISNRLVGGPSNVSCLDNVQQPGEGLSDWWLLAYTAQIGHQGTDPRGIGTYAKGQPTDGLGVRTQRYSTDPAINDHTYGSINGMTPPHGVGEVWAQVAWEMYWALVDRHGFDPDLANATGGSGNQRAMLYVNEGLMNTICSPTFVDVRDGILQAATDNFGGEDVCLLWDVFAAFGLGEDALSGGPDSLSPTEGFEAPASCPGVPNVSLRTTVPTASEAGTGGEFTITRTRHSPPALTVFYTVSGTATPGSDYVALSGSVDLAPDQRTATISVSALDDPDIERDETVIVTLSANPAYEIIQPDSATVTIVSDEKPPVVSIDATIDTATEAGPAGEFTVTRSAAVLEAMNVVYSVAGTATPDGDYVALPGTLPFAAGQATATIPVDTLDDIEVEREETVEVTLLPDAAYDVAPGSQGQDTVNVVSDESPPVIFFEQTNSLFAFEAGEVPCNYVITRSGDVSRPGPVFYEQIGADGPGVDFHEPAGVVQFAAGQTRAPVDIFPIDDALIERDEITQLHVLEHEDYDAPTFRPICNIKSDEPIPEVRIVASDPFANEADLSAGTFTITRTGYLGDVTVVDYAVSGTATPGSDYVALSGSVAMPVGVDSVDIVVDPLPDTETEPDETVVVTVSFRTLYTIVPPDSASVTILSGDHPCNVNTECDDGRFCNGAEICSAGVCAPGTPPACDDGIACTVDVCNESSDSCDVSPDDAGCDDGLFCNGTETCDVALGCQPGNAACPPDEFCVEATDTCDPDAQCLVDAECDDGSACTTDSCQAGVCFNECAAEVSTYPYGEDFETGFGDWTNVGGDDFDWSRRSGATGTSGSGPSGDHTTGSGFYLYIEASGRENGDVAMLEGPCMDLASASTAGLEFWYHMFGNDVGTLDVEISTDCTTWTRVWSLSGDQGDLWHEANIALDAWVGDSIRVRFSASRGDGGKSDIAIDDVAVEAPGDVRLQWAGPTELTWNAAGAIIRYNVYRGLLAGLVDADLDGAPDGGYGDCQNARDPDLTDASFSDTEVPTATEIGFHYLVSFTTGSGEHGLGRASDGAPRTVVPCP